MEEKLKTSKRSPPVYKTRYSDSSLQTLRNVLPDITKNLRSPSSRESFSRHMSENREYLRNPTVSSLPLQPRPSSRSDSWRASCAGCHSSANDIATSIRPRSIAELKKLSVRDHQQEWRERYKRSISLPQMNTSDQKDTPSLADLMDEIKDCRYIRKTSQDKEEEQ